MDASATGHAEMGGYGAVAPNNLGGMAQRRMIWWIWCYKHDMGGYGSSAATLGGYGATVQAILKIWAVTAHMYHLLSRNTGGYGESAWINQKKRRMPKRTRRRRQSKHGW